MPRLPDFPVELLSRMQFLVARLVLREPQRLLAPEREDAKHHETVVEQRMHSILQIAIEVDEHVSAEDDGELAERSIGDEVVLREDDVARQRRAEQRAVVL